MKTDTERDEKLQEIGRHAMSSIAEMVAALECDYDRLEELRDERDGYDHGAESWASDCVDEAAELKDLEEAAGDCESREDAQQRIEEDPLSLEYRSGWTSPGHDMEPEEYCLLLSTGGPAVRLIGEITNGEASRAMLEVQDWFTPWTEYVNADHAVLLTYARVFCMET